jgi:F420-non-reducing hydrogenase small subunit
MAKLKFAFYWAASCGGCEVAVLDINEKILDVAKIADIVFWPVALDFKYKDVEALPEKSVDVCFFNGAVRNSEQEHVARLLRDKSKVMVAFGSCACFGGIPGLANVSDREDIFAYVYQASPSTTNPEGTRPRTTTIVAEGELTIPEFYDHVYPLKEIVPVEYFLPGCPPPAKLVLQAVEAIAAGNLPPPGATIASDKALCDECKREKSAQKTIKRFYRPYEIMPDPARCLLEQGIICLGPATRGGCGALCVEANIGCRGCFGPLPETADQGARFLGAVASLIDATNSQEVERIVSGIKDPLGTFYQFTLPISQLRRVRK